MNTTPSPSVVWAFDLGKGSIGEAVRDTRTNAFPHVESLLIPAEFARRGPATASGSPANKYRALKTREAHHARERWLETVWVAAGLKPLRGRQVAKVGGKWQQVAAADPGLEREFGTQGDGTCYTSCLLRIRLLQGDGLLEEWQIYKALRSGLQRRGYGSVPWATKEAVKLGKTPQELENEQEKKLQQADERYREAVDKWSAFEKATTSEFLFPCYFDAWKMGLWNPAEPNKHQIRVDHLAGSTRNVRFDRADVRRELIKLGDEAARILSTLRDAFARWQRDGWKYADPVTGVVITYPMLAKTFGEFLCDGPAGTPDESSFDAFLAQRRAAGLRTGTFDEWMAALGQKTPKFDNRILNDCVLIPRFHVCKADVRLDTKTGQPVPESLLATEVTFLLKLKNLLVGDGEKGQRKLTPDEVGAIFNYAHHQLKTAKLVSTVGELAKNWPGKVADCFALTKSEWAKKKGLAELELRPLPGHEEVKAPKVSGRTAYSRVALRILKELILSGEAPSAFHARLLRHDEDLLLKLGSNPTNALVLVDDSTAKDEAVRKRENTENQKRGVLVSELHFLRDMRKDDSSPDSWGNLFVPSQTLDALIGRHTEAGKLDSEAAIRDLLGTINDPIVRHRLGVFAERLKKLQLGDEKEKVPGFGIPDSIVLELVREDFMGEQARRDYQKFINDREKERKTAREEAGKLGMESRSSGLRYELWKTQGGICLYTGQPLSVTKLDEYEIDHIVPRSLGGPDAAMNYVITTHDVNHTKKKGNLTPYTFLHPEDGWDAYVERVNKCRTALRNKKVQLLTREDAAELVTRYTALAETAWVSKLAQTIANLRFGWNNGNDAEGRKRVIVVSGGLTARVRRKYDLNRLLHGDHTPIEEAEKKNRKDHRHHALDAMVLTFIPQWARDPGKEGFFRFPAEFRDPTGREDYGRIREHFRQQVAKVMPRNLVYERPVLAETLYGARGNEGSKIVVQRVDVTALAQAPDGPQKTKFDLPYAGKQVKKIRDATIQKRLLEFLATQPDEAKWKQFCAGFRQLRQNGSLGASIRQVFVKSGDPTEYKDLSKDGSGSYRKAKKGHQGQLIYLDAKGGPHVRPVYAFESLGQVRKSLLEKAGPGSQFYGFFQSGCLITLDSPAMHPKHTLPPGKYLLNTIRADGIVKLTTPDGKTYPDIPYYSSKMLVASGFRRAD